MGMVNTGKTTTTRSLINVNITTSTINLHQPIVMATNSTTATSSVPLVVCSYQTGPVHGQDAIADPQSSIRGSRSVRDQCPDVNSWSVERSVLQEGEVLKEYVKYVCP